MRRFLLQEKGKVKGQDAQSAGAGGILLYFCRGSCGGGGVGEGGGGVLWGVLWGGGGGGGGGRRQYFINASLRVITMKHLRVALYQVSFDTKLLHNGIPGGRAETFIVLLREKFYRTLQELFSQPKGMG